MRAKYLIGRARYTPASVDDEGYSHPEGHGPIEVVKVYGVQPMSSDMPVSADVYRRIMTSRMILTPNPDDWGPSDHVWLKGTVDPDDETRFIPADLDDVFAVSEDVRDYNMNPSRRNYRPGGAVVIERTGG
ncbi:Uncharacterised protein [Mycobacteroides abscessus subsp. bolletii]|uniref:hypothetical protein n=1 Tax=Mycobacteroides abscessus TaxID=36809 RepID=UPI0009296D9F|nr:hypothetical protein [Mycobacteroides abscessus]SHX91926.1 Uncharacterised protein [Mycobacteroides abscessus subsp. bolletii]SKP83214.1 Uncharacterised protein [Mycobacteroides abscessus subsp. bolletii]SKP99167.1 Uncharacterised protein [Mycobacteroides abscessus subsp. bolletii]SKQ17188.1 Uncharacterised protein [Mycobacteroides abscessus subsp. bolletii]SLG32667.1 Uncharacterised protein [Mycobacteroides abscessus subsp. abscessus]